MMSTILLLLTVAPFGVCLQTGEFYPLPVDVDGTITVTSSQETVSPMEDATAELVCQQKCLNGGDCVFENGNLACDCPSEFSGDMCQNAGEPCGDSYCHNGGKCFEVNGLDGFVEYICDCTHSYTENTYYSGEFCQYPSTQFCTGENDPNGRQFCVNGGQCPNESHLPCSCPDGFSGPRCAFQVGVDGWGYSECGLTCQNGGTCQKGSRTQDYSGNIDYFLTPAQRQSYSSYEHCVCPTAFYGILCEYQAAECGNGQHLCFNGSECVENNEKYECDCSSSRLKVAGLYCEYVATNECSTFGDDSSGHRGFCANGGKCDIDSEGLPFCTCPDGFNGLHCEFRISSDDVNPFKHPQPHEERAHVRGLGLFGIAVAAAASVCGIVSILRFHPLSRAQNKRISHEMENSTPDSSHDGAFEALPKMPNVDIL